MAQLDTVPTPDTTALRSVKAPAKRAMVMICRKCEQRVDKGGDAGRRLARRLRKLARAQYGKGAVRTLFTPCMSLCPRDAVAVALVRGGKSPSPGPCMYIADVARPKAAARELLAVLEGE